MAKKIGSRAFLLANGAGEPVTLLPGQDVPDWADVPDYALETEDDRKEGDGGTPLENRGTRIDGADPDAGVPDPEDTPDPDLAGADEDAPDFTRPAASKRGNKQK